MNFNNHNFIPVKSPIGWEQFSYSRCKNCGYWLLNNSDFYHRTSHRTVLNDHLGPSHHSLYCEDVIIISIIK